MRTLVIGVVLAALVACSGDDEDPPPRLLCDELADADAGSMQDPVEQCERFLDTFCDRAVECDPTPPTHADCISTQRTFVDCGTVACVSDSFERCLSEVREQTCAVWNATSALPASCGGVLIVE